ncbi:MAG: ArsR/SmtB family transcription factor, partial [Candidatus Hodarchaeales archaeon]
MTSTQRIEDSNLSDLVFKALAHEFRRKLVFFLADAPAGFTELQEGMQCQTGTLYHHLRILGELVEQNSSNRQWALTDTGWLAYRVLTTSQEDLEIPEMRKQALPAPLVQV